MEATGTEIQLQVMICTLGTEGISRVSKASHPEVEGVEYLVSWQTDGHSAVPPELNRHDFRIVTTQTRGLSANRNFALSKASAPLLLISDDDVDYTEDRLRAVIDAFRQHSDMDILTFRYESSSHFKSYPSSTFSLNAPEKGYYLTSFEIAIRRAAVQGRIWFNENFGIGATFPSGEEDIFIRDCLDAGLKGTFMPITIARHDRTTTSGRNLKLPSRPQTKGAVFLRLHPHDWPLRMVAHGIREIRPWRKGVVPSPFSYCLNWLRGAKMARRMKVFPTPNYSSKYPCHD